MYIFRVTIFLFLTFSTSAEAQFGYAIANIDSTILVDAHTVVRKEHIEFEVESPSKAVERIRRVITVLNGKSPVDHYSVYYDDKLNKLEDMSCTVYDAMGSVIRKYKWKEMSDRSAVSQVSLYSDSRVRYIDLEQFSPPFTIETYHEIRYKQGFQSYPSWGQSYGIATEKASITCKMPTAYDVNYKAFNVEAKEESIINDNLKVLKWTFENIPAKAEEPLGPPYYEVLPSFVVTPTLFQIEEFAGSYESWNTLGDFIYRMNADRDQLSPAMEEKVRTLTKDLATDVEKIEVLYDLLKKETRYVFVGIGIGGWQTHKASYVEENKYGDCKALSNYMKAMLKVAGIDSKLVLINGRRDRRIENDFPSSAFNHMILYVPSEDMWLECTSQSNPAGYVGSGNADRNVLVVDEHGGNLVHLPAIEENASAHETTIQLTDKGAATITNTSHTTGEPHEIFRAYETYLSSQEEIIKYYRNRSNLPSFTIKEFDIQVSDKSPEATHTFEFEVPKYAAKAGKRIFVPINQLHAFNRLLPEKEERIQPVVRKDGYSDHTKTKIHLPTDYAIESMPKSELIETEFGTYHLELKVEEDTLFFERKLEIVPFEVAPERYEEVRQFYKRISKLDNSKLVLKFSQT